MTWRFNPPPARAGEPILADHANAILEVRDACAINVAPPLARLADGTIYLPEEPPTWVKITGGGTGGKYSGTEQIPTSSGGWADGPRAWDTTTNLLVEANGSTTVPTGTSRRVLAFKGKYFWYFQYGPCT